MPYADINQQRQYQREWMAKRRSDWLKDKICIDCGSIDQLEIDHIDPKKKISHRIWSWTPERRDKELQKCQVRCHVCHRKRSNQQLVKPLVHGTISGYHYRKCRCKECVRVAYLYEKRRKQNVSVVK